MSFFSHHLSFRFILSLFCIALVGGCASPYPEVDPLAKAVPAKVVKIEKEYNIWGGSYWASKFMATVYTVADSKGRLFEVRELGHPKHAQFKPGQCVTLWRASTILNDHYPRINIATSDCRVVTPEPEKTHIYNYRIDEESCLTRKLDSWLDSPVSRLVANWGEPTQKIYENNRLVFIYNEEYKVTEQKSQLRFGYGRVTESEHSCDIRFYIDKNNLISGYSWQGNNCF